jgi:putative nucleic acid modification protein with dual OB domain
MPPQEVLILAMTKMLSGICTAGVTHKPDPAAGLHWVRPVREFDTPLPGDMTDVSGRLVQCSDVVELNLLAARPAPPHVEDWLTDFCRHRPRFLRRLEGETRARFLAAHLDRAPKDVLVHHTRSLCLVHPDRVWAGFSLDAYSGKYEARMRFTLDGAADLASVAERRSIPVTDLKWRALGRAWLHAHTGHLSLDHAALCERLGADALYLTLGLSRSWQNKHWLLVVGVHVVPDYRAEIDLDHL